jgi:NTP pyrophosphatase (non-canonical NTP hydrolase)
MTRATKKLPLQDRVWLWALQCFGTESCLDKRSRTHRFLEEALELAQAAGCPRNEAMRLVDYVYGRDRGAVHQEVGGVMLTLAALCHAHGIAMNIEAERELCRVWDNIDVIRRKELMKPKGSPLPGRV